jgi:type I restriction enzyme M protein
LGAIWHRLALPLHFFAKRQTMMNPIEQQFFNDLEKKLWTAADKLRSNLDAAVYKHVVLGLIFLEVRL